MSKVAIIYLCTGQYSVFWNEFYDSFEQNFLQNYEKHYYVFTDVDNLYQKDNSRVHIYFQEQWPWPLVTLLKFNIVLKNTGDELKEYDFVYFSNANIICEKEVTAENFLPRKDKGEYFSFTRHPGYEHRARYKFKFYYEYERNPESLAYVPYSKAKTYVFGNMWGGRGPELVEMIQDLDRKIGEDLKNRIIPIWHDESFVNNYVVTHDNYRLLDPGYAYPLGFELDYEKIIAGVPKEKYFDVVNFKNAGRKSVRIKVKNRVKRWILPPILAVLDWIFMRKPAGKE